MGMTKDPLAVNSVNFDDAEEMRTFDEAWMAASIAKSAPILAQMYEDGIIDEHGRRVSTEVPEVDDDVSDEQQ